MTSRNQREGYYSGYFRKHYRSRFHRLGQKYDDSYVAFLHPECDLHTRWDKDDRAFLQSALAIGELGTLEHWNTSDSW